MRYVLNSAVITEPGTYTYTMTDAAGAGAWIAEGAFESTIGYQETADALATVLGVHVPVDRRQIRMQAGDEALVFRLTVRLADPSVKGRLGDPAWIVANSEIGILRREH